MSVCDLGVLDRFLAEHSIEDAVNQYLPYSDGVEQYERYWRTGRHLDPVSRLTNLLDIVRYSGWNMNRQGQCQHIQERIASGEIAEEELVDFWERVDSLHRYGLRDLPRCRDVALECFRDLLDSLRDTLCSWHSSAGTVCFLSKVILMFNWGQTPALDRRVTSVLGRRTQSTNVYVKILRELGEWVVKYESKANLRIELCATACVNRHLDSAVSDIPIGRALDMVLFALAE